MDLAIVLGKQWELSEETISDIQNGAMVVLQDDGLFYRSYRGTVRWWSEHASSTPVYDIPGEMGTVLVGTCKDGSTWVQWERSTTCSCRHAYDWCLYKVTGRNQGPYGDSDRTEKNPLRMLATKRKKSIEVFI